MRKLTLVISNIFPQPAGPNISVDIDLEKAYTLKHQILDLEGKLLRDGDWRNYASGEHTIQVDTDLISGTYILKVVSDTGYFKSMQFITQE